MPAPRLSVDRIAEAATAIDATFRDSPQLTPEAIGEQLGFSLTVKLETLNPIRSFKGRGTDFLLHRMAAEEAGQAPVACVSAGNFGQGLAYAGRRRGRAVHVVTATTANPLKVAAMERLGATVHAHGADFDAAKDHARGVAAAEGWRFVEDGDEPAISEGAGTIAVELARDAPGGLPHDVVVLPVGNGALAAGVGTWLRAHAPGTRLVAVSAAGARAMHDSWHAGRVVTGTSAATIADGIAIRVPVPAAVTDLASVVDDWLLVDDEALLAAMRLTAEHLGVLGEPAGVAGLAGAVALREQLQGLRVATVLCGSNVAPEHAWWLLPGR